MRKLIWFIIVAIAGLLLIGVPNLWNCIRYRQPVVITEAQIDPFGLPAYVQLQGIQLNGAEAMQSYSRQGARILVPVRFRDSVAGNRVTMVLESDDPALLEAVTRLGGKRSAAKEAMVLETFARKTTAVGMVTSSIGDKKLQMEMRGLTPELVEDFAIVREGERPSLGLAILALSLAAVLSGLLRWIYSRKKAADGSEPPPLTRRSPTSPPAL